MHTRHMCTMQGSALSGLTVIPPLNPSVYRSTQPMPITALPQPIQARAPGTAHSPLPSSKS